MLQTEVKEVQQPTEHLVLGTQMTMIHPDNQIDNIMIEILRGYIAVEAVEDKVLNSDVEGILIKEGIDINKEWDSFQTHYTAYYAVIHMLGYNGQEHPDLCESLGTIIMKMCRHVPAGREVEVAKDTLDVVKTYIVGKGYSPKVPESLMNLGASKDSIHA